MNHNPRIDMRETDSRAMELLSDNNVNALEICSLILKKASHIDPSDAFPGFGTLLYFDNFGIYGDRIVRLYDICNRNIILTIAALRSLHLGILNEDIMNSAIDNGEKIDTVEIHRQVKLELNGKFADLI